LNILLDINALIRLLKSPTGGSVADKAKEQINDAEAVYASSISVLAIRINVMLGKLEAPDKLLDAISSAGLKTLIFSMRHADALSYFPDLSRHDPFDRMLLAQVETEGSVFLTSDGILLGQGIDYVFDARQ
jgi:PIN domain nuclease of toxin-antitoxin system